MHLIDQDDALIQQDICDQMMMPKWFTCSRQWYQIMPFRVPGQNYGCRKNRPHEFKLITGHDISMLVRYSPVEFDIFKTFLGLSQILADAHCHHTARPSANCPTLLAL